MSYNNHYNSYSHTYNLSRMPQEEQIKRYDIIKRFVEYNSYFAYLPYISNPTNNYYKFSNATL